ncbi:hypothetical protein M9Y10_022787 [Tritrichomonas musculus]|uniref:Uncharacterized protein n=1 Tax=Tritrichomonas musculus TaxID=1915356 RepID=A0ABR2KTA5_9EUKA
MQQSIKNFQKLLKSGNIHTSNKYLKKTLEKFDIIYYEDIEYVEEKVKQYQNNSGIVIIDEIIQYSIKYYVVCFNYKLIIFPMKDKTESSTLSTIFSESSLFDKYFIQGCSNQDDTDSTNINFFNEIRNFSQEFVITDSNLQHFWKKIVNCVSGFLIKKGYQNSRNKHDEYHKISKEKFVEYKEKENLSNKSYIEIRIIGRGNGCKVKLIYHIHKEEIFAMKISIY